jgi:hypothetical protein
MVFPIRTPGPTIRQPDMITTGMEINGPTDPFHAVKPRISRIGADSYCRESATVREPIESKRQGSFVRLLGCRKLLLNNPYGVPYGPICMAGRNWQDNYLRTLNLVFTECRTKIQS